MQSMVPLQLKAQTPQPQPQPPNRALESAKHKYNRDSMLKKNY